MNKGTAGSTSKIFGLEAENGSWFMATGFYRINYKQVTTTMSGPCDKYGWYDVAEVPWAMYYRNLYAIHGAYWHEDFGIPKSKGCTNMAPADAKWLFHWTKPNRPIGWHSVRDAGTHVWFSS